MCIVHAGHDHNAHDNHGAKGGCETLQLLAQMMFAAERDGMLTPQARKDVMKEAGSVRKQFMANKAQENQQEVNRVFDIYRDLNF